ncbi:MAG TPA: glycosyltransferase, partial [Terracidiphilus sp.]
YLDLPDVTISENVPEMRPYFERAGVMLYAPGRGSGMKIKILEAMALGVPVVTTSEGVEGIPAVDSEHAGICENDAGLIERTINLLKDPLLQNRQRRAARQLLERHCSPARTLDGIERIYRRIANGSTPG